MPTVINLTGEFGWEIRPNKVASQLAKVDDDELIVRLSSVGGDVFDGADVVNLFLDFRRDNPDMKMNLEVKALAASYGSALMAAPIWDEIGISAVSSVMIHKASTFAYVNADEAGSLVQFLAGLDDMYSRMYSERSGKSQEEILSLMSAETWFFGQEIIDNGFADKIITMEDEGGEPLLDGMDDRDSFFVLFQNEREAMMKKVREKEESQRFDVKRAAACLRVKEEPEGDDMENLIVNVSSGSTSAQLNELMKSTGKPDDIPVQSGEKKPIKEVPMNKAELKKENPAVHDEVRNDGVMAERDRVKSLSEMKKKDEYKDIPEVLAVIDKAIEEGTDTNAVQPLMVAAMMKVLNDPNRMAAIESPGELQGGDSVDEKPATHMEV